MKNYRCCLKIDLDFRLDKFGGWELYKEIARGVLKKYKIIKIIKLLSPGKKGLHVYFHISSEKKLSNKQVIRLQYLLLDDLTRTKINLNRSKFIDDFNVFFDKVLYNKKRKKTFKNDILKYVFEVMEFRRKKESFKNVCSSIELNNKKRK